MRALCTVAVAAALSTAAFSQYPNSTPPPAKHKAGYDSITIADAKDFLGYLAGPETAGRGTGQPGYQKAAEYVAGKLKEWGIKPAGDNGTYFQNLTFQRSRINPESVSFKVYGTKVELGNQFALNGTGTEVKVTGQLVLVQSKGTPLADPTILKDAIVIRTGRMSQELNRQFFQNRPRLIITVGPNVFPGEYSVSRQAANAAPRMQVRGNITEDGLKKLNLTMSQTSVPDPNATLAFKVGEADISAMGTSEPVLVPNVVGFLEGSDPNLKPEHVGIGAHLDHLGVNNGMIYYGADDDGSGSTALLQVAKAFAQNPTKPKRGILFMWFAAEEMGLIGSRYYSDNPTVPINKMIAELQMDMVGRDSDGAQNGDQNRIDKAAENVDTIRLVGSKRISQDLDDLIQQKNEHTKFRFKYDAEDVYTRSDHYNFARLGIPIAFFFDGFHPEYHQPTDTIEKINWTKLTTTAKLCYLVAADLADRTEPLKKNGSGN